MRISHSVLGLVALCSLTPKVASAELGFGSASDYTIKIMAANGAYDGTEGKVWVRLYDGSWGLWHSVTGVDKGRFRTLALNDGVDLPHVTKLQAYVGDDGARLTFKVVQGTKHIDFGTSQWVKNETDTFDYTFKAWPDDGGSGNGSQCDIWAQDCSEGFKCVAEDVHGEARCRPLSNNPDQVGDPCSDLGVNDGDSCDVDGMCINGICKQVCGGSANSPTCGSLSQLCHIYEEGVPVCEEECDPLLYASCEAGETCATGFSSLEVFSCVPTEGPLGTSGDACADITQCAQGHACLPADVLPFGFCDGNASQCCSQLCDLDENYDCGGSMSCLPFYQSPPPGLEHVGVCAIGL